MCDCDVRMIKTEIEQARYLFSNEPTIVETTYEVIYDSRGYIRLVFDEDDACLDHSYKYKVNFCPNCGEKIKSE